MKDRCVFCGADISDQSRQYCLNCKMETENMNTTKQLVYKIRLKQHIGWINKRPPKWKFISYIKWLNERPPKL